MDTVPLVHVMQTEGVFPRRGGDRGNAEYVIALIHHYVGPNTVFGIPIDGPTVPLDGHHALYAVIGPDHLDWHARALKLPDFRGKILVGKGGANADALPPEAVPVWYGIAYQGYDEAPPVGAIMASAGFYLPDGWLEANGQLLPIADYHQLFTVIGTRFGGDGKTHFALPDLRGAAPVGVGESGDRKVALGQRIEGAVPGLGLHYIVSERGYFGGIDYGCFYEDQPLFGEVVAFAGETVPRYWLPCDGRLLSARDYHLFHYVMGKRYGGDGDKTSALPDLVGRAIIGRVPE